MQQGRLTHAWTKASALAQFVGGDHAFEWLVLTMLAVVLGGVAVNAVAYATQLGSVNAGLWIGLVFIGLFGVSTSLGQTRLVLTSLLDEPSIAPLGDPATA